MSVKHAVLGLVCERPGYGYQLDARFKERIGSWRHSKTAVFPALLRLAGDGAVQPRDSRTTSRQPRIWYEATEQGRAEFKSWVRKSPTLMPLRDEMYIKIALAEYEDLQHLIEQTREQQQLCLDRIGNLTGAGVDPERLSDPNVPWHLIGHAWLERTEVKQLSTQLEALQEARSLMKDALRRRERAR